MARRRYTTRQQDAEFILRCIADARRDWKVGDRCLSYNLQTETTIAKIDGERVTLANGDTFHVTKVRSIRR